MQITLNLADIGAKKIMMSDPRWEVSVYTTPSEQIEVRGGKYVLQEGNDPGVWTQNYIGGTGFSILCGPDGGVSARRYTGAYRRYNFNSFYDAVDWIISGTIYPPDYTPPEKEPPLQIKISPIGS